MSYTYYFIYDKKRVELYAYTDDKRILKDFIENRNMNLFYVKTCEMEKNDIQLLFKDDHNWCLLINYKFTYKNHEFYMPITTMERQTIENRGSQYALIDVYLAASTVPPKIFQKEIKEKLNIIGYIPASLYFDNEDNGANFSPDYFSCFLEFFGDTINTFGGDND